MTLDNPGHCLRLHRVAFTFGLGALALVLLLVAAVRESLADGEMPAWRRSALPERAPDGASAETSEPPSSPAASSGSPRGAASAGVVSDAVGSTWEASPATYPWLAESGARYPAPVDSLASRFPPPPHFVRVPRDPSSFGAWLAGLPLAAPGTPVVAYDGETRYLGTDRRIAAVVALDVGTADLQQCADSVIRLHAEWSWSQGRRDQHYRAAAGTALPYARFARGERLVFEDQRLAWRPGGRASTGYSGFRQYLSLVFAWANTVSLARESRTIAPNELRAGDFFVDPGNPGHAVVILDLARDADGNRVALIGQSYMPAQSFYVLRGALDGWFVLDPEAPIATPFWRPFPWETLRRLDEA